jgi:hypothetical protein
VHGRRGTKCSSTRCSTPGRGLPAQRDEQRRAVSILLEKRQSWRAPRTYVLTDFLARTFEHAMLRELGLDRHRDLRDAYFGDYSRVLWLAQRPTPSTRAAARRAADAIGLPLVVREVGDTELERQLESLSLLRSAVSNRATVPRVGVAGARGGATSVASCSYKPHQATLVGSQCAIATRLGLDGLCVR